jgi:predicted RNase H-like nuclease (RuvC/YqgF family)
MKITLKINKELLHKNICDSKKEDTTLFRQLKDENARLSKNIEEYFIEKGTMEKKIYKMQQEFEDKLSQNREIIDKLNNKVFSMENIILEKNTNNEVLKKELYKYVTNENIKKYRHVFIVEPSKANVDLNNELNYTRDIISKISKLMNTEKLKAENMRSQINILQKELNLYRKSKFAYEHECLVNDMKIGNE